MANTSSKQKADKADLKVRATGDLDVTQESGFYEAFSGFSRALRTWFIAYGVGAPVIIVSSESVKAALSEIGDIKFISYLFMLGVIIQIIGAITYKTAMWYLYVGEFGEEYRDSWIYKVSDWLSESYWVEFVLDMVTLILFCGATLLVIESIS